MKKYYCFILVLQVFIGNYISAQQVQKASKKGAISISKEVKPPIITITDLKFRDTDGNNAIDANETASILFTIENTGTGDGIGLSLIVKEKNKINGLSFTGLRNIGTINKGTKKEIEISLQGKMNLETAKASFVIKVEEPNGFGSDAVEIEVKTRAFVNPMLKITDFTVTGSKGDKLVKKNPFDLQVLLQNVGYGKAEGTSLNLQKPENVLFVEGDESVNTGTLQPNEKKILNYTMIVNDKYQGSDIKLILKPQEYYKKYSEDKEIILTLNQDFSSNKIIVEDIDNGNQPVITEGTLVSDIDKNPPKTRTLNPDAIAVVIGNSNYTKTDPVAFAINDARIIKKYLIQTMGYKENNILYYENASKSDLELLFGTKEKYNGRLYNTIKEGKSDVFIYYSGHGAPNLKDKKAYLLPVECDPQYIELLAYPLSVLYENIGKLKSKSTTIILEACFSGAGIYKNISPVIPEAEEEEITNAVVITSTSGNQASTWYNEEKHGLFTYFFLKAIHNKNADINKDDKLTFEEIYNYVSDKTEGVPYFARRKHGLEQNPKITGMTKGVVFINY